MDSSLQALSDATLFAGLPDVDRDAMLAVAAVRSHDPGQMLFTQGDAADTFYLVSDGSVKLVQATPDGREMIVRFIRPKEVIAAVALIPGGRYPVTAIAAEPCVTATWSSDTLRQWVARFPKLHANIMAAMAMHMQDALSQGRELATAKVPQRLAAMLLRLAERHGEVHEDGLLITQPLSREQIAEMTGTTLFTVSRTLSEWQDAGLVSTRKRHIVIHDRDALARLAG
ncbi:MAG: Crp/Fnr family transcriptional regulator [Gammaproteobacteria bacterium]